MITSFLERMSSFGDADAIVSDGVVDSYDSLCRRVAHWRAHLGVAGIRPGRVVALEAAHSAPACAALLALVEQGAVVVPLPVLPDARRAEFHDTAEVETVVTLTGGAEYVRSTGRVATHPLYGRLRDAGTPGLVLFSSGTTGRSKDSVLDFDRLLTRYRVPGRPRRTLSFLSLDHIGGLNTLFHTLGSGGAVITVSDRTPDGVMAAVAADRAQVLPTTPTFLNMMLIGAAHERHDLSSLELVTYGTEPMPSSTLRRLTEALPGVRLKQTYGLSEVGILPTRSRDDASLWMKLGDAGFESKVVDGALWIRSEVAMLGYLNATAAFDEDGFFDTQDLVETDGDFVRVLGRRTEIINVGGLKVYPSEVESVLLGMPNVADVTVSGQRNPVTGMVVKATILLVEPEDGRQLARRVRRYCSERLEPYKVPAAVEVTRRPQHSERFKKDRRAS
jgi:acyl-CoA synthetase (AMP-forming)/AMP-acid ligase II